MTDKPTARVCARCKKPGGTIPFWHKGKADYYHLRCFAIVRRQSKR